MSFGSNDTIEEDGKVRVDPVRCLENLAMILDESRRQAIAPMVVGPPPVIDAGEQHLRRISELAGKMAALCQSRGVPFIATTRDLADDRTWTQEAIAGDGGHPGSGGYQKLADIILGSQWHEWIAHGSPSGLYGHCGSACS
ncbi:GDSL-type esterase/lipase family protein [Streptomyces scopuliridis]|uniref:GDSL-type esterase/lipase family protein n=1 Tax=Streptomyces scopuliridis TaxID=452529 RepID=UPI0035DBCFE5